MYVSMYMYESGDCKETSRSSVQQKRDRDTDDDDVDNDDKR